MTVNRVLDIVRAPGRDAYQILLLEYNDHDSHRFENTTTRILTETGWAPIIDNWDDPLPANLPYLSGRDLSKQTKRFARRLTRKRFMKLMRELNRA